MSEAVLTQSTMSDEDKPLEFSAFDLMPDWAQESAKPKEIKQRPRDDREDSRGDSRGGGGRDDRRGGFRGDRRGGGDRRGQGQGQGRGNFGGGDRRGGGGREDRRGGGNRRGGGRDDFRGGDRRERPPEDKPAPGVKASIEPSDSAIKGITRHIRETYRAFPLADLAKMILSGRDRYQVCFEATEDGVSLYQCKDDKSIWLSRDEAIKHLLSSDVLSRYYVVEEVDVGAPAGNFSNIAVCGMSGEILGPPNHHEYQRNIARLHAERFANMPLERYKSRIVMESGEEIVEKWKEKVSKRLQYRLKSGEAPEAAPPEEVEAAPEAAEPVEAAETVVETENSTEAPTEVDATETAVAAEEAAVEETVVEEAVEAAPESEEEETRPEAEGDGTELVESGEEAPAEEARVEEAPAPAKEEGPLLKSPEELARHFREHFASEAVIETKKAVVRGDVQGRDLSRGLLVHLKQESEKLRRGFPLPLIQALCRDFEKEGLRFFKRGKKALHVSSVRPKEINESVSLTGHVQAIIDRILAKPGMKVIDLLVELADDFTRPEKDQAPESLELTVKAKTILKDLRWLTSEGYVIEFPDTKLALGKQPKQGGPDPSVKKTASAKKKALANEVKPASAETEETSEEPAAVESEVKPEVEAKPAVGEAAETLSPGGPATEESAASADEVPAIEQASAETEEPKEVASEAEAEAEAPEKPAE